MTDPALSDIVGSDPRNEAIHILHHALVAIREQSSLDAGLSTADDLKALQDFRKKVLEITVDALEHPIMTPAFERVMMGHRGERPA